MDSKKSALFSFRPRNQLAVMYLISGSDLPQAKTKGGQGKYSLRYWKITKQLSSKPIKVKKDKTQYFEMKDRNVEVIKSKIHLPENYLNYQKIFQKYCSN